MENQPVQENSEEEDRSSMQSPFGEEMAERMRDRMDEEAVTEGTLVQEPEVQEDERGEEDAPYLIMDGRRSLGGVLRDENISLSELLEMNDGDELILAEGVRIYLPKRV